jgi:hypothetical protein
MDSENASAKQDEAVRRYCNTPDVVKEAGCAKVENTDMTDFL